MSPSARVHLERFGPAILAASENEISVAIIKTGPSRLRDELLSQGIEGAYSAFYAPFGWVNDRALT